jgi:adenine-specific DNA-methyltransferase
MTTPDKPTIEKLQPDDPDTQSADVVAENIARLKALFPEIVTEGKNGASVNVDVLKQLVGDATVTECDEKFGLNWHGKRRARQLALTPSTGTLRPCPEESVDWDTTQNLFIEGDNLEVLKLLQKSYAGRINLIYIDPPYNTGKDFVYKDDFKDGIVNYKRLTGQIDDEGNPLTTNREASGRFHTNWLSMLLPRLRLLRQVLHITGVIAISIDDTEFAHLRAACDEVFGEENFVATFVWEKSRKNDAKLVSVGHEYIVIYARSKADLDQQKIKWREEKPGARELWKQYLSLKETHGNKLDAIETRLQEWFSELPKSHPAKKWSRYKHVDEHGPWRDDNISWPGGGGPKYDVVHPVTGKACAVPERGWVFSKPETMARMIEIGVVVFRSDHTEPPIRKSHIRPIEFESLEDTGMSNEEDEDVCHSAEDELATQVRGSYFYKQAQVTAKYMRKLMGGKVFDNPKDHDELARLFAYVLHDDAATVLDCFAGSGTSGHAVWVANAERNAAHRFILVQLPEPLDPSKKDQKNAAKFCDALNVPRTIAELTKERLRRSADAVRDVYDVESGDLGFRVFKLDSSNIREWEPSREDIAESLEAHVENLRTGRTEQDILYELLLKRGLDLCVPIETKEIAGKTVHSIGAGTLFACLSESITADEGEPLALGIVAWHQELDPAGDTTVVFRDSAFADDVVKTNVAAILDQSGLKNVRSL